MSDKDVTSFVSNEQAMWKKSLAAAFAMAVAASLSSAYAQPCAPEAQGEVNVLASAVQASMHIARAMQTCASDKLAVSTRLTDQLVQESEQALAAKLPPFGLIEVTSVNLPGLAAAGQLTPLTELVKKYKERFKLDDRMLIQAGGEVMAIAFMRDTQALFYRKDALAKAHIAPPTTTEEMLRAAQALKAQGFATPLGGTYREGRDLFAKFTQVYLSLGGEFFEPGSAKAVFANDTAELAIDQIQKLLAFMAPMGTQMNASEVANALAQGRIAMAELPLSMATWHGGARGAQAPDQVAWVQAPASVVGGAPASTELWHGFASPKAFEGNKEAAFLVLMRGLSEEALQAGRGVAPWLRPSLAAGAGSEAVDATPAVKAPVWPRDPYFALCKVALARQLVEILIHGKSPKDGLVQAALEYEAAAREKGFLKP